MSEPIHIISLGGGVQSSTMALMAAHGEITPMPKCAVFADTQGEPEEVYEWLNELTGKLPFPVHKVTKGSLESRCLTPYFSKKNKKMTVVGIPAFTETSIMQRQCTNKFKVAPVDKVLTREMRESGVRKCVKWIGISLDEAHRMKPSRRESVDHRWPLIDLRMNRNDCLQWMNRHCYRKPTKSRCRYCPYQSDNSWSSLTELEFKLASEFESKLQEVYTKIGLPMPYLHKSRVPLGQV